MPYVGTRHTSNINHNIYGRPPVHNYNTTAHKNGTSRQVHGDVHQDVYRLATLLFKRCQLLHHINNWTALPSKIQNNLSYCFKLITPPSPNSTLHNNMEVVLKATGTHILETVQTHFHNTDKELINLLILTSPVNVVQARQIAETMVKERLHKMKYTTMDSSLKSSLCYIESKSSSYTHVNSNQNLMEVTHNLSVNFVSALSSLKDATLELTATPMECVVHDSCLNTASPCPHPSDVEEDSPLLSIRTPFLRGNKRQAPDSSPSLSPPPSSPVSSSSSCFT